VVVVAKINPEVINQSGLGLGRAPGSPKQPIHICPEHGASMVERKKRIKAYFLELSLSRDAATLTFHSQMGSLWKVPL
jgi:hypothetical protein